MGEAGGPRGAAETEMESEAQEPNPGSLGELIDLLDDEAGGSERVTVGSMMDAVGRRSFGPLLLLAGLIAVSPLSGIPGMPTTVAVIVVLIAGQLLGGRDHFWIPGWVERRGVSGKRFSRALGYLRKPAGWIDRVLRPRLTFLTRRTGCYGVAVLCICVAATMPPLEPIPFLASLAGAAIALFGLSLITHDGLLTLLGVAFTTGAFWIVISRFFS